MPNANLSPDLSGVCNFLMSQNNVAVGGLPNTMTVHMGNWVGGRFTLSETALSFAMNKMNAALQKDTGTITIPRTAIRRATKGRMMMVFATVDLDTDIGTFRIRATPKGTRDLLQALGRT
jgi:hypothetical protein